jgi:PPIC-type PPIASE domain.
LLSEIIFELNDINNLEKKYNEIVNTINNRGFDYAALKYSISQTSKIGGKLDWISENSLNKKVENNLNSLNVGDITNPINLPVGFLILKINNIKNINKVINVEEEFKKIINSERNNQLNQFSKMYYNKVKNDVQINEI